MEPSMNPPKAGAVLSLVTITGVGARSRNEDAGFAERLASGAALIVCDGMGGEAAGDEASRAAVEAFRSALDSGGNASTLRPAVREAAMAVAALNEGLGGRRRAGTTLVAAVIEDRTLHWANVGDSRIYLIRGGQARCLSTDHSVPMMLLQMGEISAAEIRKHPDRNRLTRSLGREVPEWDQGEVPLHPGDVVLLCSDGFWEPLEDEVMARICSSDVPLQACLARMAEAIVALGAADQDNYTAVAARWEATGGSRVAASLLPQAPAASAGVATTASGLRSSRMRGMLGLSVLSMLALIMALALGSRDRRDPQGDPMAGGERGTSAAVDPGPDLRSPWQRAELAFADGHPDVGWAWLESAAAAGDRKAKVMLSLRRTTKAVTLLFPIRRSPTRVDQAEGTITKNSSTSDVDAGDR
jgi:PPM family protein phosphatase